jgi:hypothetical protein
LSRKAREVDDNATAARRPQRGQQRFKIPNFVPTGREIRRIEIPVYKKLPIAADDGGCEKSC